MSSRAKARRRPSREGKRKDQAPQAKPVSTSQFPWPERLGWAFLGILTVFFLATSWRKWPDPLIDFGHNLYIPWRLAHGSLLYRDVDDIYGPLSQYLNAGLFRVFGTSIAVLTTANILVFVAILTAVYVLFRWAWGRIAAFLSSAIFISVFAFGQYVLIGNYNYAAPYSQEATHGMLVCVLLLLALVRWVEHPTVLCSFLAGGLLGLTAVLKPEFLLAGGLITLTALCMRWRFGKPVPLAAAASWAAATVLPTLGFAAWFSAWVPWREALVNTSRAWLNATSTTRFASDPVQLGFLGLNRPWENLTAHAIATIFAALLIAGICATAWLAERSSQLWERVLLCGSVICGVAWLSFSAINWLFAGRCLLGLTVAYVLVSALSAIRAAPAKSDLPILTLRLMIGLLAAALMARMFLNGRIFQYGFYQAALSGLLVPAVMIGDLPSRLGLKAWGKTIVIWGALALFVPGALVLAGKSQDRLALKTLSIGQGGDQFYAYPQTIDSVGELVRRVTEWLGQSPGRQTLVVLPEGEMINYLVRMPNPVPPFMFYSHAISEGREEKVVNDLQRQPPDWVVIISRDLRDYGIQRYGEAPGKGEAVMRWVTANYERAMSIGGDPLDVGTRGAVIMRHKKSVSSPRP